MLRAGQVALAFLTRLPSGRIDGWRADDLAASAPWFPLVGLLVGALAAAAYGIASALGLAALPAAVLAVAAAMLATGGLHEDGLADFADAQGGRDVEARLRIMRDSRLGSFGAASLILALLLRVSLLASLAAPGLVAPALLAAGALSRAPLPAAMTFWPAARPDGLAAGAGRPHPGQALATLGVALLASLGLLPPAAAALSVAAAFAAAWLIGAAAQRQLGGITGDVLGAGQQAAEIAVLLVLAALAGAAG